MRCVATDVDRRTLPGRRRGPEIRHVRRARARANRSDPFRMHACSGACARGRPVLCPLFPPRTSLLCSTAHCRATGSESSGNSGWCAHAAPTTDGRERPLDQPRPRACMLAAAAHAAWPGAAVPVVVRSRRACDGRADIPADSSPESDPHMLARSPAHPIYQLPHPAPVCYTSGQNWHAMSVCHLAASPTYLPYLSRIE